MESSRSKLDFGPNSPMKSSFNLTVAASPKASVTDSYFSIDPSEHPKTKLEINNAYHKLEKSRTFCWMVSQCNVYNDRFTSAAKIINQLPDKIHMWGRAASRCMPLANKSQVIDHGPTQKFSQQTEEEIRTCKFYFAFENSNCSDYITEKFPNALANYAVPIVNGWRDSYVQRLPGSFIHVADFEGPDRLAEYLKFLLQNETAYLEYHYWRTKYDVIRSSNALPMRDRLPCRICDKVYQIKTANEKQMTVSHRIPDLGKTFLQLQNCAPL
ncbi:4-galactosyl-N-acetylglucosaminide 3-alpha-L-fucosyltransferase 9-like [Convolutriloba macropyga]|uniref:4-galactosyl-N-acetylglucosaminide 3-alpha-L-fucosyltransferase 9-like n=1 Tax=Convolutriloba macropyga TaxID=536237 RepID=UPI003F51EBC9